MKRDEPDKLDQYLSEHFSHFEEDPPPGAWEMIRGGLDAPPVVPKAGLWSLTRGIILASVSGVMVMTGLVAYLIFGMADDRPVTSVAPPFPLPVSVAPLPAVPAPPPVSVSPLSGTLSPIGVSVSPPAAVSSILPATNSSLPAGASFFPGVISPLPVFRSPLPVPLSLVSAPRSPNIAGLPLPVSGLQLPGLSQSEPREFLLPPRARYRDYYTTRGLSLSAWYRWLFLNGRETDIDRKKMEMPGIGISWNGSGWVAGFGLERYTLRQDLAYRLLANEFLGTYFRLDSIIFHANSSGVVPEKILTEVSVFDTALTGSRLVSTVAYTYLRIPVTLGYEYRAGRFSFTAGGGVAASFRIGRKSEGPDLPEFDRINRLDRETPEMRRVSYQWLFDAGIRFHLTDQAGLLLEPGLSGFITDPAVNRIYGESNNIYIGGRFGLFWRP